MKRSNLIVLFSVLGLFLLTISLSAFANCTVFMVGKDASKDGSIIISTSQDQPVYDARMEYIPPKDHAPGTIKVVYDFPQSFRWWDEYGKPKDATAEDKIVARIPEVEHTYGYIRRMFGVMNENQVSTAMATMSGENLSNGLWNDYTKLRMTVLTYIALERAKTAKEALEVITLLAEEYGFKGESYPGKSMAIADPNEIWLLHMTEPGPFWTPDSGEPGAIWVAQRLPDDHVGVCPNGFSIQVVDFDDHDNFAYSSNLVSFAEEMGWYNPDSGAPFNFNEAYSQNRYTGFGVSLRSWRAYQLLAPNVDLPDPDESLNVEMPHGWHYRYPFSVKSDRKIGPEDLMPLYRDKLEGTKYDLTKGPLAGPYGSPTRTMGLTLKKDGDIVGSGRALAADGTTYAQINVMRSWLPDPIGGIVWWAPGRGKTSFFVPFYCGINDITSEHYTTGNQTEMEWGKTAYWAATFVNTFTDVMHYYIIQDVQMEQQLLEGIALGAIPVVDNIALELYKKDPGEAKDYLTRWSNNNANETVKKYWEFANYLIVKYHNRYINIPKLSTAPKIPDFDYWFNLALEYQRDVRGRELPEDYY